MTLPSLITVGIKYGSWGVVTLILLIPPVTLFTIFLINALYILILKVSTPEKFKNIILYLLECCAGKPNVGETVLYKLLYFSDFNYYELYEEQLSGAS